MKPLFVITASILFFIITSCSKNYTCECQNPGGTEKAFTAHCKKSKADKKCADYYDEKYGDIPMSETHCGIK